MTKTIEQRLTTLEKAVKEQEKSFYTLNDDGEPESLLEYIEDLHRWLDDIELRLLDCEKGEVEKWRKTKTKANRETARSTKD